MKRRFPVGTRKPTSLGPEGSGCASDECKVLLKPIPTASPRSFRHELSASLLLQGLRDAAHINDVSAYTV